MGHYGWGWNWWGVVMMLAWPLLLGLAAWAVVALTRERRQTERIQQPTPREILDRRLAAGEISEEDYARTRHLLKNGEPTVPTQGRGEHKS